ncbi:exosortase K [Neolewinella lacunae]|uniref:Exosortase K n=1 Tax=Neolewinella lacunae TaxID=1517758 RepID=A0A923PL82_9BACT|nr:exosortase K [Neolewinella lacunae]MBC6996122.1 exosortase K [Neolewinella lacunae]MDN3633975.1 exosortase K [Neolewinella lacunae]
MNKYLMAGLVFVLLKWWHQTATAEELLFLLAPTDALVSTVTGSAGLWEPGSGYFHAGENMVIDASCSGFNFLLISYLLFSWLLLQRYGKWRMLWLAMLLAWPLTILANFSRILTILLLGSMSPHGLSAGTWHEMQGAFVYFSVLVMACGFTQMLLKPKKTPTVTHNDNQPLTIIHEYPD